MQKTTWIHAFDALPDWIRGGLATRIYDESSDTTVNRGQTQNGKAKIFIADVCKQRNGIDSASHPAQYLENRPERPSVMDGFKGCRVLHLLGTPSASDCKPGDAGLNDSPTDDDAGFVCDGDGERSLGSKGNDHLGLDEFASFAKLILCSASVQGPCMSYCGPGNTSRNVSVVSLSSDIPYAVCARRFQSEIARTGKHLDSQRTTFVSISGRAFCGCQVSKVVFCAANDSPIHIRPEQLASDSGQLFEPWAVFGGDSGQAPLINYLVSAKVQSAGKFTLAASFFNGLLQGVFGGYFIFHTPNIR